MPTADLFNRPAEEGARLVALGYLEQAHAALARLAVPDDADALHDFRVALRRLRSCLRAYRPVLTGSVPGRRCRKLRALAAATGVGRDTEVQLAWLRGPATRTLPPRQRPGLVWLTGRLEARRHAAYEEIRGSVGPRYEALEARLAADLAVYPARVGQPAPSFTAVTAALLREHATDLRVALAQVGGPADETQAHEARIRGKRLRYLVDPLRGAVARADGVVGHLKRLQEILGDLHDTAVLTAEIRPAVEDAAAARARHEYDAALAEAPPAAPPPRGADTHAGLLALALLLRRRRDERFGALAAGFLDARAEGLFADVEALAADLEALAPEGLATRTWLVRAVPAGVPLGPELVVDEGWLPGDGIDEHVRRERGAEPERCYRVVRVGGASRVVEIPAAEARALWALTAGRRLRTRRRALVDASGSWMVRAVAATGPLLVSGTASGGVLPPWLEKVVAREVTGDPAFTLRALAERPPLRKAPARRAPAKTRRR